MKFSRVIRKLFFKKEFRSFAALNATQRPEFPVNWQDRWPRVDDDTGHLPFDAHYCYHTAWAARVVAEVRPDKHIDISSYTFFATIVSAFVPVDFYDYRPADIKLSNMCSAAADLCKLSFADGSIASLSCMHTIEHIGLGRYGDPIDPNGDKLALAELERVVAPGGNLLIVVPVGKPRIQFNAHRIYSPQMLRELLPQLDLHQLAVLPDDYSQGLIENPTDEFVNQQKYACGCFWFRKPN